MVMGVVLVKGVPTLMPSLLCFGPQICWTQTLNVDPPSLRPRMNGVIEYLINQQPIGMTTLLIPVSGGGLIMNV